MQKYFQLLTIIILCVISSTAAAEKYTIIIDAGSSGSKLHLFQYQPTSAIPVITEIFSANNKMGLATFSQDPNNAGASLKSLLDGATKTLLQNKINPQQTTIHVLATAGMRLLPEPAQQAIYANVRAYLNKNYAFIIGDVQTISGKMEGLYGWLDINYLLETFQHNSATVGSIDMGGASTQIAFATKDNSYGEDGVPIVINQQHYHVFSKSFIGLGQDQALNTMTNTQYANYCYPSQYIFNNAKTGNYNMLFCRAIYADIINNHRVSQQIPNTQQQKFVAFSGIYFTYDFFKTAVTPSQFSLENQVRYTCHKSWEQLQKDYPQVATKYLASYCAHGAYFDQLLYNVYKITGDRLTVATQINQKDINWALGAMLYRATLN